MYEPWGVSGDKLKCGILRSPADNVRNELSSLGELQLRNTFLDLPVSDTEEVLAVRLGKAIVAFGDVGCDRE